MVENMPNVLMRDSVTYRNAVRFGLVRPIPHPVRFYFERLSGGRASSSDHETCRSSIRGIPLSEAARLDGDAIRNNHEVKR